jgi:WD40 repeat protein/tetratricopeptide (TPR) repeat protein/tRNA A-37 threonylcarbamoyl transferase component Bud32
MTAPHDSSPTADLSAAPPPAGGPETATLQPQPTPSQELPTLSPTVPHGAEPTGAVPDRVPGYEILEVLGRGGMGVVYKARQARVNRTVALKMILSGAHAGETDLARFRNEAEAIARLQHPHIVQIHEVGEHDSLPFFSLEFCPGGSLEKKLTGAPLPPRDAAILVERLARAMHAAHAKGVVHRDLKPANVLLAEDGTPKITDFGLAKLEQVGQTATGAIMGTPSYMAPEQAGGKSQEVGPAADVYALGAILYELLTGRPPFRGPTTLDTLAQVLYDEPVPPRRLQPTTPRDLETVCLKCLQKDPRKRYASAQALAEDLNRFQTDEPILARPVTAWERAAKWARRRPAVAGLITALVVVGVGGFLGMMALWLRAEEQRAAVTGAKAEVEQQRDAANAAKEEADEQRDAAKEAKDEALRQSAAAKKAEEEADRQRNAARQSQVQAEERLTRQTVANGIRLMEDGDLLSSLVWFAEALKRDQGKPEQEDMHRTRLGLLLRQCPKLEQAWTFPGSGVRTAEFSPDGQRVVVVNYSDTRVWDTQTGKPLTPLLKHTPQPGRVFGQINKASFSPDGKYLVTASGEPYQQGSTGEARVWNAATGDPVTKALQHSQCVRSATFSPDGRWVATACGTTSYPPGKGHAQVWDATTGKEVTRPLPHEGSVAEVVFSPDGQRLVTACQDRKAHVWDVKTGTEVLPPLEHKGAVRSAIFSPDGRRLVTLAEIAANEAKFWDATTGKELQSLKHRYRVNYACFSPTGRYLATAAGLAGRGSEGCETRLWDAATGTPADNPTLRHTAAALRVSFSPDGRRLLTAHADQTARVWDVALAEPLTPPLPHGGIISQTAFSRDGRHVLTVGSDRLGRGEGGEVRVWLWPTATEPTSPVQRLGTNLAFSPDSRRAVAFDPYGATPPGGNTTETRIPLWDVETGRPATYLRHRGRVHFAGFSSDGRSMVTLNGSRDAQVWDLAPTDPVSQTLKHPWPVAFASLSPDGRRLLTVSDRLRNRDSVPDLQVRSASVALGFMASPFGQGPLLASTSLHAQTAENYVRFVDGEEAYLWDLPSGTQRTLKVGSGIGEACFSPDDRRLAIVNIFGANVGARVWDAESGRPVTAAMRFGDRFGYVSFPRIARMISFSPDSQRLVFTLGGNVAQVWDAATGKEVSRPLSHGDRIGHVAFSPDGRTVLTASEDGKARVWDATTGQPISPLLAHGGAVQYAAYSPDSRRVVTASTDKTARVWDAATGEPVCLPLKHDWSLSQALFLPDGRRVVTQSSSQFRLWNLTPDDRPVEDLALFSQLLAGRHIDSTGSLVAPEPAARGPQVGTALSRLFSLGQSEAGKPLPDFVALQAKYPAEFTSTVEEAVAWHEREFQTCKSAREWPATLWHLDRLAELDPKKGQSLGLLLYRDRGQDYLAKRQYDQAIAEFTEVLRIDPKNQQASVARGNAHAELKQWDQAFADFSRYIELGTELNSVIWPRTALAKLAPADRAGYRQFCAKLLTRFGETTNANAANNLAWCCALAPDALADLTPAVKLAQQAARREPPSHIYQNTYGSIRYRAGEYQEAVTELNKSIEIHGKGGTPADWLFLAMAQHRLGRTEEAKRWLDKAVQAIQQPGSPSWNILLELQLFRQEAEALILPK